MLSFEPVSKLILVLTGLAVVFGSCGGDAASPPTAETLQAVGGTALVGFTDSQLDAPLQVRVTGSDGMGFAGQVVSWAVTSGAGRLSAPTSTSDEGGVASVDWTLGPAAGPNTVTASASGLGSVTFTADATFATLEPQVDIPIEGEIEVERVIIPAGVTVTVMGPTTVTAENEVRIEGSIAGDCHALEITGGGSGEVSGSLSNACASSPDQVGPDLSLTVDGAMTLSGSIVTSGTMLLRNTPDISVEDIRSSAGGAAASGAASVAAGSSSVDPCVFDGAMIGPPPGAPPASDPGEDGADGPDVLIACSGDLTFQGDGVIEGGLGSAGGAIESTESAEPIPSALRGTGFAADEHRAGDGGNGGNVIIHFPMKLLNFVRYTINLKKGEAGGDHRHAPTAEGASATSEGGNGGNGGGLDITGRRIVIGPSGLTINAANGGDGGSSTAEGADGRDAQGGDPARDGGSATAKGGNGGETTRGRLSAGEGVTGEANIELNGARGGKGGHATAKGGLGGRGDEDNPNGADGGSMSATGGAGGTSRTQNLAGSTIGNGGDGGWAFFEGGTGGRGFDFCTLDLTRRALGGFGGDGGDASGRAGLGGDVPDSEARDGEKGKISVADGTGSGGAAGDGDPDGGFGGGPGNDGIDPGGDFDRLPESFTFDPGKDGEYCNDPPELTDVTTSTMKNTAVVVTIPYSDREGDAPKLQAETNDGIVNGLDPAEGEIVAGSWATTPTSVSFTFQPAAGFVGQAVFQVAVLDQRDAVSNNATVTVNVLNAPPIFNDGAGDKVHNVSVGGSITNQPVSVTDADGDELTVTLVSGPAFGTFEFSRDGESVTYSYQNNGQGEGQQDRVELLIDDGVASAAHAAASAQVGITGLLLFNIAANFAPVCLDLQSPPQPAAHRMVDVMRNSSGNQVILHATDPENDPIDFVGDTDGDPTRTQHGTVTELQGSGPTRFFSYTPDPDFAGKDLYTYEISDDQGNTAQCEVWINVRSGEQVVFTTGSPGSGTVVRFDPLDPQAGFTPIDVPGGSAAGMGRSLDGEALIAFKFGLLMKLNPLTGIPDANFGFSGLVSILSGLCDVLQLPNGTILVTNRTTGEVFLLTADGELLFGEELELPPGIEKIEAATDGSKIFTLLIDEDGDQDGIVILNSDLELVDIALLPGASDLEISPDGYLWVVGEGDDGELGVLVYDVVKMELEKAFSVLTVPGAGVGVSFDPIRPRAYVTDSVNDVIYVFDDETCEFLPEETIVLPEQINVRDILFTEDGLTVVYVGETGAIVHDLMTGEHVRVAGVPFGFVEAMMAY